MLRVHIFDVGHGDSILLEFPGGAWGVVDCKDNNPPTQPSSLLRFLRERNVRRLAFVCLTHPHGDHFSGLPQVLEEFGENVDEIWSFRLDSQHWRKFLTINKNAATTISKRREFEQLRTIFEHLARRLKKNEVRLLDANQHLPTIGEVQLDCLAPHPKELSSYQTSLARWSEHPEEYRGDENRLSVVLRLKYGENTVLLGSDATSSSWMDLTKQSVKTGESIRSILVKVSHHGSTQGFFKGAWETITTPGMTHGAISAGVQYGLPHRSVITSLRELGVRLHCTNYAPSCIKTDELDLSKFEGLSQADRLQLFMLDQSLNTKRRTCDGDLHFELHQRGNMSFAHQYAGLCPYHLPIA